MRLPREEAMPDDIPLAKLTVQCTLSVVTGAIGDGVAWHLLTPRASQRSAASQSSIGEHGVRKRGP